MTPLTDEALNELIPRLRRFAYSLTRDLDSADDLVQASLEKALSAWQQRHAEKDLRAWLFTILYRQFLDFQRRQSRRNALLALFGASPANGDEYEEVSPGADTVFESQQQLAAFSRLPHEQRALLLLVAVEGLSYDAISRQLGIPLGTVMSRISRARAAFKQLTQDQPAPGNARKPSLRVLKND
ncbi:RNA polymerase sigma factor [Teredinibacter turnerae]|uniref:RNA polymerase sigma factor n=1 Tax=Teredinibacter turnerae TaxID=2426 RepID=UPI000379FAF9|nr:RNA polymerase sigma factor [Teredinibacter turnerae]